MSISRTFLGFHQPALAAALDELVNRFREGRRLDLTRVIVVVPGRRAGRRLLELLVARAEAESLLLSPPIIETVGRLPEQLYPPQRPFADEPVQQFAWSSVLRRTPPEQLRPLVPHPPDDADEPRWWALADLLRRQHIELAADGMSFRDVLQVVGDMGGDEELRRWEVMAAMQDEYHLRLDHLQLWDRQTARLKAVEFQECHTDDHVFLLGTVDLNRALRQMLAQVREQVTALVAAPEDWRDRFDDFGCLIPEAWQTAPHSLADDQVVVADGPAEQAEAVVDWLAARAPQYTSQEITIGVPDEQLIPDILRQLEQVGLRGRWGPGRPLAESGPFRAMAGVAETVAHGRARDVASLLRHPDVEVSLRRAGCQGDWLDALDRFHESHVPFRLSEGILQQRAYAPLRAAVQQLTNWLAPLRGPARPLTQWSDPIWQVYLQLYDGRKLDRSVAADRQVLAASDRIWNTLQAWKAIPAELVPTVTSHDALRRLLDTLSRELLPAERVENAVELLGWLELPLDDAPALVVTSLNEGRVPESVNSDLFLPNALRQKLGLLDNDRRYARDAYSLATLVASRRSLRVVVGRRTRDDEPLAPSRLLFNLEGDALARRALRLFSSRNGNELEWPAAADASEAAERQSPAAAAPGFSIPLPPGALAAVGAERPPDAPVIQQLSVTSFRDYLACPYRFYLRHVLKLRARHDRYYELDGAAFGQLAHEILRRFGLSEERDATDPQRIEALLQHELNQCANEMFGREAMPAVQVQIGQLRLRLAAFARHQAERARAGWRIEYTEVPDREGPPAMLDVDGEPIELRGRIDRIDRHDASGQFAILDYKTSDRGDVPDSTHRKGAAWIDLQLPLYRHLAQRLGLGGSLQLGYVLLPKDVAKTGFALADWDDELLGTADLAATEVVRGVRAGRFWPPAEKPPAFSDDFATICQDHVFEPWDWRNAKEA